MISWAIGVNTRVLRSGSSWNFINGVVEDETRSGKKKRRLLASMGNKQYSVNMRFSPTEYTLFKNWYENSCRYGFFSFQFPKIDSTNSLEMAEYRFVAGSEPSFSNPSGTIIECSMQWEEV